jgi:hypothetical protein
MSILWVSITRFESNRANQYEWIPVRIRAPLSLEDFNKAADWYRIEPRQLSKDSAVDYRVQVNATSGKKDPLMESNIRHHHSWHLRPSKKDKRIVKNMRRGKDSEAYLS